MSVSGWLQRLFGRRYQPTTPPRPDLTPEEDEQRREQLSTGPDDPKLARSEDGDGAG
jgi:hypothetical protein